MESYLSTQYLKDALRIYAICSDQNFSDEDTRVIAYMHAKAAESGKGIDYFRKPSDVEEDALEIMVGDVMVADTVTARDGEVPVDKTLMLEFADYIRDVDRKLEETCGFENRISGELRHRLRLYRDKGFREKMIGIYSEKVAPKINAYSNTDIDQSFARYRERKVVETIELEQMFK